MKPTVTREATHNFQPPKNWNEEQHGKCGDLQVRMQNDGGMVECISTWKPNAQELALLNAGGVVEVGLCIVNQPVMSVAVVTPVEPDLIKYVSHEGAVIDERPAPITINEEAHGL